MYNLAVGLLSTAVDYAARPPTAIFTTIELLCSDVIARREVILEHSRQRAA